MFTNCKSSFLPECFGDFGGNYDIPDSAKLLIFPDVEKTENIIKSSAFESKFREILPLVHAEFAISKFELTDGRVIYSVPDKSRNYILAAELAYAMLVDFQKVVLGTNDKDFALLFHDVCSRLGLKSRVILGVSLIKDKELIDLLGKNGTEVDSTTCEKLFDLPYIYPEIPSSDSSYYPVHLDANFGPWPRPAMISCFASFFGRDIINKLEQIPETCCIPIRSGVEALALFKAFGDGKPVLATCEELIAAEYHMIDTNAYTISTRSAVTDEAPTSICPELVNLWRKCKVLRLGCDRIIPVDLSDIEAVPLNDRTKRAALLAFEETGCKQVLTVEV